MDQSTIAAIATPLATGSIGVVRISGPEARQVGARVFRPKGKGSLLTAKGYTALYGHLLADGQLLDEAVALVFAGPKSYTGEDVVELSCHGGVYILKELLRAVLAAGALPAGPGEFTKRAFLNGKLSLTQAEGVMNLISAKGRFASKAALSAREGALHREVGALTDAITRMAAHLAAWVDYPEEDLEELETQRMGETLGRGIATLTGLLAGYDRGQLLREGIPTAIVGRPNVGKSTLMNLLAGSQRSIVTDLPGTTRDVVESQVLLGEDVILLLADTAGLRETADPVEAAGVALARDRLSQSQLVLAVFDGTQPLGEEDRALIDALAGHPVVAVLNKSDLPPCEETIARLGETFGRTVQLSAKTGAGRELLLLAVKETLRLDGLDASAPMAANERQRDCIRRGLDALTEALGCLEGGITLDAVSVCVDEALGWLLELDGKRTTDAVVDAVFANFCVGK